MKRFFFLCFFLLSTTVHAYQPAVVTAHPEATKVGLEILKKGGSAADAAIAAAFALSVVEPHNSGLGGGGFLLYFEAKSRKVYFIDYRESAPAAATSVNYASKPEKLKEGALSVAVPGFVKGMEVIHKRWRRVSWPAVLEPSIELAKKGIGITSRMKDKIQDRLEILEQDPEMNESFVKAFKSGGRVNLDDLAATLEDIKTGGAETFYRGGLSQKIVQALQLGGGILMAADMAGYQVYYREPVKFEYAGHEIYSSPIPSSGGRGLDLLLRKSIIYDLKKETPYSPRAYEIIAKINQEYLEYREIGFGDSPVNIIAHTTHLNVIDEDGNIAAMTNTLNFPFGAGIMVPDTGIILNNEMDDFSLLRATANPIRAGRRPLSSMAPTIVFKKGHPVLAIGTPGGLTIPQNLFQTLFFHWDWKAPLGQAIRQSKVYYSPKDNEVVAEKRLPAAVDEWLQMAGMTVKEENPIGNVQALIIETPTITRPVTDLRGEGRGLTLRVLPVKEEVASEDVKKTDKTEGQPEETTPKKSSQSKDETVGKKSKTIPQSKKESEKEPSTPVTTKDKKKSVEPEAVPEKLKKPVKKTKKK